MELIRLEDIHKTYHLGEVDVPVLRGVSLSIARGEMVALMGASGSGKTTLMNILGCLDRPSSGKYWLDGQEMSRLAPNQRALVRAAKLGFVFQNFSLLARTTALANVLMPLDYAVARPSPRECQVLADALLDRVGLSDRAGHEPSQMSGGQQQRVAIARALVNRPALLLADEPTGNLDSRTSVEILRMFQRLNAEGITVILVTHDPQVASYAHRVIRVHDGRIEPQEDHTPHVSWRGDGHAAAPPAAARHGKSRAAVAGSTERAGVGVLAPPGPARGAPHCPPAAAEVAAPSGGAIAPPRRLLTSLAPRTLGTALRALRRNKMRSALTALGVIIGVAAVITMVEIGQGSKASLQKSISRMGANTLMVQSGAASSGGISFGSGSVMTLTPQDAEEIGRQCPDVLEVAPIVRARTQVVAGSHNWVPFNIYGTTPSYLGVQDWAVDEGEFFTDRDVRNTAKVCVIGKTLKRELFEDQSPIGKEVRIKSVSFRVTGVLARKGANMMGMDQDDIILAPWTTIKYRVSGTTLTNTNQSASASGSSSAASTAVNSLDDLYPKATSRYPAPSETQSANRPQPVRFASVDQILAKAASADQVQAATSQITELLRERHRIRKGEPDDFNIRDMAELTRMLSSTSELMGGLLLAVALISLVVGGVGIMNIMLVSVTERTREIGLRMAVGGRSHHILRQFLVEAVVLCLLGGAVGIALGRGASTLVRYFLTWSVQPSLPAIVAAVVVSVGVGVLFGFYPAWKASRLDPIEALRYE